jgi:hypothetical protein
VRLADTACEDLEDRAGHLLGPFRLTKALLSAGSVGAKAGGVVLNVSSDAPSTPIRPGARGASKGSSASFEPHLGRRARFRGRVLLIDPGDMDTPLHTLAVPDANPSSSNGRKPQLRSFAAVAAARRKTPPEVISPRSPNDRCRSTCCATRGGELLVVAADGIVRHAARDRVVGFLRKEIRRGERCSHAAGEPDGRAPPNRKSDRVRLARGLPAVLRSRISPQSRLELAITARGPAPAIPSGLHARRSTCADPYTDSR